MALSCKGSAVLQCGYPWKPDDPPAYCRMAAPDGRGRRRGRHYAGRSYDHLLPFSIFKAAGSDCGKWSGHDLDEWKERLTALGYERTAQVDGMGQFSICGGIVDIFPLTEEVPVRIELWDDEVDSIRSFDPESQRGLWNSWKRSPFIRQRKAF